MTIKSLSKQISGQTISTDVIKTTIMVADEYYTYGHATNNNAMHFKCL